MVNNKTEGLFNVNNSGDNMMTLFSKLKVSF